MKDDKPGSPPELPKPTDINPQVSFSYEELQLQQVMFIDNEYFLLFMLRGEYLVQIKQFEYFSWLNFIFTEISIIQDEDPDGCICNLCTPTYDLFNEEPNVNKVEIDPKTKEIVSEETSKLKVIFAYNLCQNTKVGYHSKEEHQ